MNTNSSVGAVNKSRFSTTAEQVIQVDRTSTLAKAGKGEGHRTCRMTLQILMLYLENHNN